MMHPRAYLAIVFAALIGLTAQSAAVARAMPDAAGQMILCTGQGPMMVYMDAEGNPTSAPHICPDYALSLIVALGQAAPVVTSSDTWTHIAASPQVITFGAWDAPHPQSRGPPRSVVKT